MAGRDPVTLGEIGEDLLVETLLKGLPSGKNVLIGPGDDCAVLKSPQPRECLLLKTDCIVEGVHFLRDHDPARVGWKALCRAISDIGAMGGTPQSALITIFTPQDREVSYWKAFYRGLARAARRYHTGIVGGETSRASQVAISITLLGRIDRRHIVSRSGGRPGDLIFVTGRLGGSLTGKHLDFQPRVTEGAWLAVKNFASAMMDLSDGLATDLPRLAKASNCAYQINPDTIPRTRGSSLEQALSDGEDYELLFTAGPRRAKLLLPLWKKTFPRIPLTEIGVLTAKSRTSTTLPQGFDHFYHCQQPGKKAS